MSRRVLSYPIASRCSMSCRVTSKGVSRARRFQVRSIDVHPSARTRSRRSCGACEHRASRFGVVVLHHASRSVAAGRVSHLPNADASKAAIPPYNHLSPGSSWVGSRSIRVVCAAPWRSSSHSGSCCLERVPPSSRALPLTPSTFVLRFLHSSLLGHQRLRQPRSARPSTLLASLKCNSIQAFLDPTLGE